MSDISLPNVLLAKVLFFILYMSLQLSGRIRVSLTAGLIKVDRSQVETNLRLNGGMHNLIGCAFPEAQDHQGVLRR